MKMLRIIGILILVAGIAAILFSNYITTQVKEGKLKITQGEQKVNKGKQLFSLSPATKEVGGALTQSADKKIQEGKEQVGYYEQLASELQIGGIIGCIVGAGLILFSFIGKNGKRR
jgi:hypothetical protein